MPSPADLIGGAVSFVSDLLGSSSLRLGIGPTLVVLGILLVFLQLVARPVSRWVTGDPGGLGNVGREMALAAESGTDAVVSIGTAGLARSADALARLQTVAAMPLLAHVARSAARSGVPLRILVNDPLAGVVAEGAIAAAHAETGTLERVGRSRIVMVGEGRAAAAGLVMTARAHPAAAFVTGSLHEEGLLHLEGLRGGAGSLAVATADTVQAPAAILAGDSALIGPELFRAPSDLRSGLFERTSVLAANRLIGAVLVALIAASALALAGVIDPIDLMLGIGPR